VSSGVLASNTIAANYAMGPLTSAVRPALSVSNAGPNFVNYRWTGWANTWSLYYATNLASPINWFPATNSISSNSGQFQITVPADSGSRFFRLSSP
jgi:hypothetical protein